MNLSKAAKLPASRKLLTFMKYQNITPIGLGTPSFEINFCGQKTLFWISKSTSECILSETKLSGWCYKQINLNRRFHFPTGVIIIKIIFMSRMLFSLVSMGGNLRSSASAHRLSSAHTSEILRENCYFIRVNQAILNARRRRTKKYVILKHFWRHRRSISPKHGRSTPNLNFP